MRTKREIKSKELSIDNVLVRNMTALVDNVLVRNVTALVETTADLVCADGEDVFNVRARLFSLLEAKCAEKKKMCKALAVTKPMKAER